MRHQCFKPMIMKKIVCFIIVFLIAGLVNSQENTNVKSEVVKPKSQFLPPGKINNLFPKFTRVQLVDKYELPKKNAMHIKMDYGKYEILNPEDWQNGLADKKPRMVELVMTLHPSSKKEWRDDFYKLIGNRMKQLYALDSVFLLDDNIHWKISLQNHAKTSTAAKKMFHGLVIHYSSFKDEVSANEYLESLKLKSQNRYAKMTELDKLNRVLGRLSKKYKNMLIITDCTASMEPYGVEVALWHLLQDTGTTVNNFVFFNDGDGVSLDQKFIGNTGGIHFANPQNPQEVINTIRMVTVMGNGNFDAPENDLEAIIKAIDGTPNFDEVVLIVDNNSAIRDIELLHKIDVPVRVVLCGLTDEGIHFDYIRLAFHTKGSLHTVEEDISILMDAKDGDKFKLDEHRYQIVNGNIVCLTKDKGL